MKWKGTRKMRVRILGVLMSAVLLAGNLLSAAQPVYAAGGVDTFITHNHEEDAYCFAIEGGNLIVKSVPLEHRDKTIGVELVKLHLSESGVWVGDQKTLYKEYSVSLPHAVPLPQEDGKYQVLIPVRKDDTYKQYKVWFTVSNGGASFEKTQYYDENKKIYSKRSTSDTALGYHLQPTWIPKSDVPEIRAVAEKIVNKKDSDYVKIQKIHDWVAANIWYDYDRYLGKADYDGSYDPTDPFYVLKVKRAVCGGYAALTAELLRSLGIPTIEVSGGAHAWNEAYADGRWIILDTTWDSQNKYRDGEYSEQKPADRTYFDPTLEAFSADHRISNADTEETVFWMEREFQEELSISQTSLTLKKGKTTQLSIKKAGTYKYVNLKDAKITYSSSNKKAATVSKKGKITAKKAGTAVITTKVTLEGVTLKFKTKVTVKK